MNYMDSFEWLLCPVCNSKTSNASKANDVIEITLKWIKNILQIN